MNKYLLVLRNTWEEALTYRLSFAMWRLRNVLSLLVMYFLWSAIIPPNTEIFGYTNALILTYILGTSIIGAFILSTRTHEIGENINSGDLSLFLIRPINYFVYWFYRDIGDKLMNIVFSIGELTILFILLKPPFIIQTDPFYLFFFILFLAFAILLNFFAGALLGMIGFWSPEVWAPRFIFFILITFFAGGIFPLDIFPKPIYAVFQFLPFTYLLYFPLKVYLGQMTFFEIMRGLIISGAWIYILYFVTQKVWQKGLRIYTAQGR